MIEPNSQGAEATLAALAPVLAEVYPVTEAAVHFARDFFGEDEKIDSSLFPNLVRYSIKVALNQRGLEAVEEDGTHLNHEILANNGLFLRYGSRHIRIRKADHGSLPTATSTTLKNFYEQRSMLEDSVEVQKLLLLWDLVNGVLEISLACPKEHDSSPHWHVPVPHPAQVHVPEPQPEEPFEFDVPISLPEASTDD
jgi:hypothetical protein